VAWERTEPRGWQVAYACRRRDDKGQWEGVREAGTYHFLTSSYPMVRQVSVRDWVEHAGEERREGVRREGAASQDGLVPAMVARAATARRAVGGLILVAEVDIFNCWAFVGLAQQVEDGVVETRDETGTLGNQIFIPESFGTEQVLGPSSTQAKGHLRTSCSFRYAFCLCPHSA